MKILCLADLHINSRKDCRQKIHWVKGLVTDNNPDVIVIAGDIFESGFYLRYNPYEKLSQITDVPIICVLGNHEFVDMTVENTLKEYCQLYNPQKYNVHYLDIIGHYDIGNVRFSGNVLWYDGSMKEYDTQDIYEWGNGYWLDKKIIGFDYEIEHNKCIKQIDEHFDENKTNVLITHCVPHKDINGHLPSELNAFSGIKDFFETRHCNYSYSISGHTHKRVVGLERGGCKCINIGNDYYPPYDYYLLEI